MHTHARTRTHTHTIHIQTGTPGRFEFVHVRRLYPTYTHSQLSSHIAIVHVPYQVSYMSFVEQFRQGIPLLVPSLSLLSQWHKEYGIVFQRCWHTGVLLLLLLLLGAEFTNASARTCQCLDTRTKHARTCTHTHLHHTNTTPTTNTLSRQ